MRHIAVIAVLALSSPAIGQQVADDDSSFESGILVKGGDVTTCPYRVVQPVSIAVTEDYDGPNNRRKVFAKFRAEAQRLKADAIVKIERGTTHMSAWAFARREYHANAIRYVDRACAPKS